MKKNFIFFFTAVLFSSTAFGQQWIAFSGSESKTPEINVSTSNTQMVNFTVTLPGIYRTDTVITR